MNKTFAALLVAAAGFAAAPGFAQNLDNPAFPEVQGAPISRTQVDAELSQYQQRLASGPARAENPAPAAVQVGESVSRAQVAAELRQYQERLANRPARAEDGAPL